MNTVTTKPYATFSFIDYTCLLWGERWAIARSTPRNQIRCGRCITHSQYRDAAIAYLNGGGDSDQVSARDMPALSSKQYDLDPRAIYRRYIDQDLSRAQELRKQGKPTARILARLAHWRGGIEDWNEEFASGKAMVCAPTYDQPLMEAA